MLFHLAIHENGGFCGQRAVITLVILVFGVFLRMGWCFWQGHPCFSLVFEDGKKIFLAGIAAFLVGHILYLVALIPETTPKTLIISLVAFTPYII